MATEKLALAEQILQAREEALQRGVFGQNFRQYWLDRFARLSVAQLVTVAAAGPSANLEEVIAAPSATVLADTGIQSLGDSGADLVYTKVAPCRIADSRVAGGPLGTASSRDFYVVGTTGFTGQGGAPCGIPLGATSVAMNVTVVGATGYGGHVLLDVMGYFQYVNKANYRSTVTRNWTTADMNVPFVAPCHLLFLGFGFDAGTRADRGRRQGRHEPESRHGFEKRGCLGHLDHGGLQRRLRANQLRLGRDS